MPVVARRTAPTSVPPADRPGRPRDDPGPALGSERRPVPAAGRLARAPILVVAAGALLTLVFMGLAAGDALGLAGAWLAGHWLVSAGSAFVAVTITWRESSGHERTIHACVVGAAGLWALSRLVAVAELSAGATGFPGLADLILVATAVPGVGWLIASLDPRLGRTARTAGVLDVAAIVVAIAGIVVVVLGQAGDRIGGLGEFAALGSPAIFFAGAVAVSIVAVQAARPGSFPIATLAMAAGLALFGAAGTAWLIAGRAGGIAAGDPAVALLSLAPLAVAAGSALGRPAMVRARADPADSKSSLMPIATALIAALVLVFVDDRLGGVAEIAVRVGTSITIVLIVARQTMLLSDRRVAAERERAATVRAEVASAEASLGAQRLAAAENRFRHLVEQVPAAVYLDRLDADLIEIAETVYISPRIEALTGFTPAEISADNDLWMSRVHRDDEPAVLAAWDLHCSTRAPFSATYRFQAKDGRLIWLAEDAGILEGDGAVYSQGTILDVTDRRETEQALRQAQKMEAVGQLAGGVAHDFNNLLTVITGHAGLLRDTIPADDAARIDVDAIATAAASSADLVGQLLAFGRRTMLRPEILDIGAVVRDTLPMLRRLLPEHIDVVTAIGHDVPAIRADPGQIQQVVLNLAINGRDAMPGGGTLTIGTSSHTVTAAESSRHPGLDAGPYVLLTIADDGIGMDAGTRDRVFEPFFTTKAAGRGTGLGLATVYGIVKQTGGYISIDSAIGLGSTFRVFLPATTERVASRATAAPVRSPRGSERIVVCEDEPAVRDLVATVLGRSGYTVLTATNPAEALLLVADRRSPADLLLTDIVMPGLSGPDLARRALALQPDLRVVLMSGYALDAADREAVGRHAGFLAKPFDASTLAATIRDVLDGVADDERVGRVGRVGGVGRLGGVAEVTARG